MSSALVRVTQGEVALQDLNGNPITRFQNEWADMKQQPHWLEKWLQGEYNGETHAVTTMRELLKTLEGQAGKEKAVLVVQQVLRDEANHIALIGQLLKVRGVIPSTSKPFTPLPGMEEPEAGSAKCSYAEAVRAGQIRVVVEDPDTPEDIRGVFSLILREESFHERSFRTLAGEQVMFENLDCGQDTCWSK